MTDIFLIMALVAATPFAVAGVVALAVPGPLSKRVTYGVVAAVLATVSIGLLWLTFGRLMAH